MSKESAQRRAEQDFAQQKSGSAPKDLSHQDKQDYEAHVKRLQEQQGKK